MATIDEEFTPASAANANDDQHATPSPIWLAALNRYYAELNKGGLKHSVIEKDLWNIESPGDLLAQIETLAPIEARTKTWTGVITQLEAVLLGLNDFAAIVSWSLGMNGKVAAVLWGSIRLIIKVSRFMRVEADGLLKRFSSLSLSCRISWTCFKSFSKLYRVSINMSRSFL